MQNKFAKCLKRVLRRSVDEKRTSTTISYDEKPGIQAIKNIASQLQPEMNQQAMIKGDHEYKR